MDKCLHDLFVGAGRGALPEDPGSVRRREANDCTGSFMKRKSGICLAYICNLGRHSRTRFSRRLHEEITRNGWSVAAGHFCARPGGGYVPLDPSDPEEGTWRYIACRYSTSEIVADPARTNCKGEGRPRSLVGSGTGPGWKNQPVAG